MKPLEALEIIKKASTKSSGWMDDPIENVYNCEIQIIEKAIKTLEIIKNKRVDIGELFYLGLKDYNQAYRIFNKQLTQEEFDLLKEVLR